MKYLGHLPLLTISLFVDASDNTPLMDLSHLRWENRLIIVNQPADSENALVLMEAHKAEINDRDIVWFIFDHDDIRTNYVSAITDTFTANVQQQYQLKQNTVTLIGKDGYIKSQKKDMDVQALFSTIDAMPMRRREMLQKSADD